jgi:putative MATE family efflux protein
LSDGIESVVTAPNGAETNSADAESVAAARRRRILAGPIVSTLLRLSAPTVLIMVIGISVGVIETFYIGFLGTEALAGVTLIFPSLMLMQMMSGGGIGAGVSSAVARAVGAGRKADADALLYNALVLGAALGLLFTAAEFLGGPTLYRALGASGAALQAATTYADLVFGFAALTWVSNLLVAALRGSGDTLAPAVLSLSGLVVLVPLSPLLIFGLGPVPSLGVAGAGIAAVLYQILQLTFLICYLRSNRCALTLSFAVRQLNRRLLADIFRVGGLAAVGAVVPNLTVMSITGAVGRFGTSAIAGYGLAARLDYILTPLLFGLGTGVLIMVGTNVGARQMARARRISWIGAFVGAGFGETIGLAVALAPTLWIGLFSHDATVVDVGTAYLRVIGPLYGLTGIGMLLGLAAQGAGRAFWPLMAGVARLAISGVGGWLTVSAFQGGVHALFLTVALGGIASCAVMVLSQRHAERRRAHGGPTCPGVDERQ